MMIYIFTGDKPVEIYDHWDSVPYRGWQHPPGSYLYTEKMWSIRKNDSWNYLHPDQVPPHIRLTHLLIQ